MSSFGQSAAKRSRATGEQLRAMVDMLSANPSVASGKFIRLHGKLKYKEIWMDISDKLNEIEGADKSVHQWQTVWRDLKSRTMNRFRATKRKQGLSGESTVNKAPLTNTEKRLLALIKSDYVGQTDEKNEEEMDHEEMQLQFKEDLTVSALESPSVEEDDTDFHLSSMLSEDELDVLGDNPETPTQTLFKDAEHNWKEISETNSKILKIIEQQSDTLRILAESSTSNAQAIGSIAEATRLMAEVTKNLIVKRDLI